MKKKHEVLWADVAEQDLVGIIDHLADESPINAKKILKKIKDKTSNLYSSPERGRVVPELLDQGISKYRELIVSPWRIIYRISVTRTVYILSVLDGRRNLEDILLERLLR